MTGPPAHRITVDSVDGVKLAAYQWGAPTAPPVVLVHGYPDSSAVWHPVAERLADRFHVTAFDVREPAPPTGPGGCAPTGCPVWKPTWRRSSTP